MDARAGIYGHTATMAGIIRVQYAFQSMNAMNAMNESCKQEHDKEEEEAYYDLFAD